MPRSWRRIGREILERVGAFLLDVLIIGSVEMFASFLLWLVIFRSAPLGFSMALTVVGFIGWFIAFLLSFRSRPSRLQEMRANMMFSPFGNFLNPAMARPEETEKDEDEDANGDKKDKEDDVSLGERMARTMVFFIASLIPLGIAFAIRLQADFALGKSWEEIFPQVP